MLLLLLALALTHHISLFLGRGLAAIVGHGSVSSYAVHNMPCPTVVVREKEGKQQEEAASGESSATVGVGDDVAGASTSEKLPPPVTPQLQKVKAADGGAQQRAVPPKDNVGDFGF